MKPSVRSAFALITVTSIVFLLLGLTPLTSIAGQESKHVFVLNSFNHGYSWTDNMLRGIDDTFSRSGIKIETYTTFMDMKRIQPTPKNFRQIKESIREGYKGVRFDAVLACDNDAFEFTNKYRDELFPGVPVVFSSINDFDERMLEGRRDSTGTSENTDYTGTIKVALQLLPATKNIVVVTDNTTTGQAHRSAVEKIRPDFPQRLGFTYISLADMTMDELAGKLSKLENGNIVLLLQHFKDKNGASYTVQESTPLLTKNSSVPVFVLADIRIGLGALGGHVVSGYHHGEAAAQMVVKILKGTDVTSIPVLLDSPNKYMFDYSVMQRFNISERDLPQGSILINKPVSLLDQYRPYLYATLGVFIVLSGFVAYLLFNIRVRKKTEREIRLAEASLQTANDKLQERNEELQMIEEELRSQNDELLTVEEFLRESEFRWKFALEGAGDGVWDWNIQTGEAFYSQRYKEMLGFAENEIGNTSDEWLKRIHPEDAPGAMTALQPYLDGKTGSPRVEFRMLCKDGSWKWIVGRGMVVSRDSDGKSLRMIGTNTDISDRKRLEEERRELENQLIFAQKMESLGVLAGGIAHDFNNILAIIIGYCSLTKMDYEDAGKHIPEIEKAAERAAALCRQMLAYAGKALLTQNQLNTWILVDEMVTMLKTTIQKNVVITPNLGTDIPTITGDDSQIRQVVMNLIINAAEAIGDAEGEIKVSLAETEIKAKQLLKDHLGFLIPAGRYICLEVTDNGCGMDEETRRKIFEPFYTTKFTGRGLGMSAVLGIIKAHNGALQMESQPGLGTTFKVYLPVQISSAEVEEAHRKTVSAAWQGSGTILLAEDEEQVRLIAIALLQKLGFTVIDAANGTEALELYQQNAAEINLVITDMGMPLMNGYELFYKLKQLNPKLPIIISSGFGEGDIAVKIPREEIAGLLNKPYTFDQLREVLRGVMEGDGMEILNV
jgi:PAS domain S-box-containing protein